MSVNLGLPVKRSFCRVLTRVIHSSNVSVGIENSLISRHAVGAEYHARALPRVSNRPLQMCLTLITFL
jgi:hypothetical protein